MKIFGFICIAIGVFFATSALALTPNTTYMVKLSTVSSAGQLTQMATTAGTSDPKGKISFSFSNPPTSTTARFLMVQIIDGNSTVVRQAIVAAPAAGNSIGMGVNELSDKQAKAMLKVIADTGSDNPTPAMLLMTMVRSGAISDSDAQNFSPLAQSAANAMETFMMASGVTATQMATFKANVLTAMGGAAAQYKAAVDATTPALAAGKQGAAMSGLMDALVKAGADADIPAHMTSSAFNEARKAAETAAATSPMSPDVITAMKAAFRVDAQHCQLSAEMRRYADAMSAIGASAAHMQQFTTASDTMSNAITSAQANFEQMFTDSATFPHALTISAAESAMLAAMQTSFNNFVSTDAAASISDISDMLSTMATRMSGMGGMMSGMTATTLANMSIGKMMTVAGGALQNWTIMMVSVNDFLAPGSPLTYTRSATLPGQLTALGVTPPTPPTFSQFADPYKSLLELQYDLMLLKLIDIQKLAQLGTTPTQAQLAQITEDDIAAKATIKQNIGGLTDAQKDSLLTLLAVPVMM